MNKDILVHNWLLVVDAKLFFRYVTCPESSSLILTSKKTVKNASIISYFVIFTLDRLSENFVQMKKCKYSPRTSNRTTARILQLFLFQL